MVGTSNSFQKKSRNVYVVSSKTFLGTLYLLSIFLTPRFFSEVEGAEIEHLAVQRGLNSPTDRAVRFVLSSTVPRLLLDALKLQQGVEVEVLSKNEVKIDQCKKKVNT